MPSELLAIAIIILFVSIMGSVFAYLTWED
jgi:hypothetical protein